MKKFSLYLRVSTSKQEVSGLSFEAQQAAIDNFLSKQGEYLVVSHHTETETGTNKRKRPKLQEALEVCKRENATLVVASLTRLSRNVHFISGLVAANVPFIALDMPSMDKNMAYFMAIMAEWEADAISKRVTEALAALKRRGVKLGKPENFSEEARAKGREIINPRKTAAAQAFASMIAPRLQLLRKHGSTLQCIADEMNTLNTPQPSGKTGSWTPTTVRNCLKTANYL